MADSKQQKAAQDDRTPAQKVADEQREAAIKAASGKAAT
jgi:hypothetical protein